MAINTYLIGNDGSVTMPSGGDVIKVKTFAATLARPESDLTGFGDTGKRRRLGMLDLTGSLTGVPAIDSTASVNTASFLSSTATAALTLTPDQTAPDSAAQGDVSSQGHNPALLRDDHLAA